MKNPSPVVATASHFKTRDNLSAIKNFGTKHFFTHKFSKATDFEVTEFLKARVAILEKEAQSAKFGDQFPAMFVLADCCAVLAEKCSTIGEKAHYHAMAVDNLLHSNSFDFIIEQAQKAAFYFHLANNSPVGFEGKLIRYNAIAAMALKSTAHQCPRNSQEEAQVLHQSSERAQFAETLLWNRASRNETAGSSAQEAGDCKAASEFFLKASDDHMWIALLAARGPFMPLLLFDGAAPVYMLPKIPCADAAPSLAKAASLLFMASSLGDKPEERLQQAFSLSCSAALALENGQGIAQAAEKAFSLIYNIPSEQAGAEAMTAFLSGVCTELERRSLWKEAALLSWHSAWLSTQNASHELFSPLKEQYLESRMESLKRAKIDFEQAEMPDKAKKIESMLAGIHYECEKPPVNIAI